MQAFVLVQDIIVQQNQPAPSVSKGSAAPTTYYTITSYPKRCYIIFRVEDIGDILEIVTLTFSGATEEDEKEFLTT